MPPLTLSDKFEYWCYKNPSKVALYHRFISIIYYPFALLQRLLMSVSATLLRKIALYFPSTCPSIERTMRKYFRPRSQRSWCSNALTPVYEQECSSMVEIELYYREQTLKRRVSLSTGTPRPLCVHNLLKRRPKTYTQSQSPFFTQLPAEIRMQIYALVLTAEPFLHIAFYIDTPSFVIPDCQWGRDEKNEEEGVMKHMECMNWATEGTQGYYVGRDERARDRYRYIPLLRSCRRIYTETIDLVYMNNTFVLSTNFELSDFARFIPPRHFSLIQSLILYVPTNMQHDSEGWQELLRILKCMPLLRQCRMFFGEKEGLGEELLGPLKELPTRDAFVVELGLLTSSQANGEMGEPAFEVRERWVLKDLE